MPSGGQAEAADTKVKESMSPLNPDDIRIELGDEEKKGPADDVLGTESAMNSNIMSVRMDEADFDEGDADLATNENRLTGPLDQKKLEKVSIDFEGGEPE